MGMFSWFTQDTNHRIVNGERHTVYMTDNKGNSYKEECYEGYGVFGGKDYYELLAEMNGYSSDRDKGIELAFADGYINGDNPHVFHPSLTELKPEYMDGVAPESDPDQGFPYDECEDEYDYDDYNDEDE